MSAARILCTAGTPHSISQEPRHDDTALRRQTRAHPGTRGGDQARLRAAGPRQHGTHDRLLRVPAGRASRPSRAGVRGGRAYDTAGQEEKARELYERALDLGLAGDTLRRCLCQYGSTLRWLGQYNASLAALDRAKRQWPESDAVRVFRALTLNDACRSDEAVAELMTVITAHAEVTDLGRWAEGLRGLAQWLADGRPDNLLPHELESGRSTRIHGCALN